MLRLIARLPLRGFHTVGGLLGWAVYALAPRYRRRLRENLQGSGRVTSAMVRRAAAEAGKTVAELVPLWFREPGAVNGLVRDCDGWQEVEQALARRQGILFLTPHLGCFEISARYGAQRMPMTVLYRPPRKAWLEPWMAAGRRGMGLAPANVGGVRRLLRALKRGEAVGLLPDQVPSAGDGAWAPFFGRPAYTMTLAERLRQATGCAVILAFAERLPQGRGYRLHLVRHDATLEPETLNRALEALIRRRPEQYLWGYHRYKAPRGERAALPRGNH